MIHNILCKLGLHDWHVNDRENKYTIECKMAEMLDPCQEGERRANIHYIGRGSEVEDRLCLNCDIRDDQILIYGKKYHDKMYDVKKLGGTVKP